MVVHEDKLAGLKWQRDRPLGRAVLLRLLVRQKRRVVCAVEHTEAVRSGHSVQATARAGGVIERKVCIE